MKTRHTPNQIIRKLRKVEAARAEDRSVRALVEATMRSLKQGLGGDKLPTRGLARASMVLCGAALMVNLSRLHRWREMKREERSSAGEKLSFLTLMLGLRAMQRTTHQRLAGLLYQSL